MIIVNGYSWVKCSFVVAVLATVIVILIIVIIVGTIFIIVLLRKLKNSVR